jgi:hypothetical protein
MAAKGKAPKKFKQARSAAKADAKKVFSGKTKARLKDRTDPLTKYSADDKKALSEVTKEAKGNYITDDRGNKVRTVPTETAKERFNREGFQAREKFRQDMANEFKEPYGGKTPEGMDTKPSKATKSAKSATAPAKPATAGKKAFKSKKTMGQVSKAVADATKPKTMTRAEKSAANKAKWAKMTPAERKNWASQRQVGKEAAPKPVTKNDALKFSAKGKVDKAKTLGSKRPTITDLKKNESAYLKETKSRLDAAKKTAKPASVAKTVAKKPSTLAKVGKTALTVASLLPAGRVAKAGMLIKGAVAGTKTAKVAKAVKTAEAGKKVSAANTARKAANAAKAEKAAKAGVKGKVKKVALGAAGFYAIDKIPTGGGSKQTSGGSSTPRTVRTGPMSDWSKRSSAKINKTFSTAGGSTTSYTVKKGDTLSGIAKASGVKLSEVLAANPTIADKKSKYKGGSMIWSGTKVKLPTKK